jgi:hypothetical protein
MPRHLCALCGQISFATYHEYEKHRAEVHNMKTAVRPENITGRTPKQIVEDAERTWLKPYLINPATAEIVANTQEHLEACRCMPCFNRRLDSLIASQELSLECLNQGVNHAE